MRSLVVGTLVTAPAMIKPVRLDFVSDGLRVLDAGRGMTFHCALSACKHQGVSKDFCSCTPLHAEGLLHFPQGLHTAANGSFLVADTGSCVIRRFDPPEIPLARDNRSLNVGRVVLGSLGKKCSLNQPHAVTASADLTTVIVADTDSHCIRAVHSAGTPQATESVIAGVCGFAGHRDGSANQALFDLPHVVRNSKFNEDLVFIGEQGNGALRLLNTTTKNVSTIIGGRAKGHSDGNVSNALLNYVHDIRELDTETLVIVEYATNRLRQISSIFSSPQIKTIAGSGSSNIYASHQASQYRDGPAGEALFYKLAGLAVRTDVILLAEYSGKIRQVHAAPHSGVHR